MSLFSLMATLGLDASSYQEGLDESEKGAKTFGEKLKSGLGTAAKGAATAIGAVTTAAVGLGAAMVKGAADVGAYGDTIDKESQKLGISAEAYQEWDAIMQHAGGSVANLKPALKTLSKEIVNNSDAFQELGLSQEDLLNMPIEDALSEVITKLQGMDAGIERTRLATQLLGRSSVELGALLNTSAEDTQAMRDRVHELGGVMSNEAVAESARFQDNLQDLTTAFEGAKRGILQGLMPGLNSLMEGFTMLIVGEEGAEEAISDGLDQLVDNIMTGVDKGADIMSELLPRVVVSLVSKIPDLIEALPKIFNAIIEGFSKVDWADLGIKIIQGVIKGLTSMGSAVLGAVKDVAGNILGGIKSFFGIHSPSAVMRDQVGKMLGEGLAEGIDASSAEAEKSAESMADDVLGGLDSLQGIGADFGANMSAGGGYGAGVASSRSVVINVYGAEGQNVNELAEIISQKIAFGYRQEEVVWA